jgi:glycosyltransferase involved in cell wall biosynthesis
MRIAQVAPLFEAVPPVAYGGTERIVSYLTEELVRQGHEVTLFASGDSRTAARLIPICPRGLRLDPTSLDPWAHHALMLERVRQAADQFDVLHFHCDYWHFPLSRQLGWRCLTTLHGRLDVPDLAPLYREFDDVPLVSISNNQRRPLAWVNYLATIYHGLPADLHEADMRPCGNVPLSDEGRLSSRESDPLRGAKGDKPADFGRGKYLLFLGRICDEKRPDRAIEIAKGAGIPLKIAAKVDPCEREYFEKKIKPLMDDPLIEFLGEVGGAAKDQLIRGALALVSPIDWPEPFGLVMIEAMACGTPVVAWRCGSVPEVVDEGLTGFIVESIQQAVEAVHQAVSLDRRRVREQFERRFTAERMAREYVAVYERLLDQPLPARKPRTRRRSQPAERSFSTPGNDLGLAPRG